MKCFSSSILPLSQTWQILSSGFSPRKRPVSILRGKTPQRNCAKNERSCFGRNAFTYSSVLYSVLNVMYVRSFDTSLDLVDHSLQ